MTGPEAETPAAQPATPAAEAAPAPAPAPELESAKVPEVEQALQDALAKANENYDIYMRAKAEAENVRRRAAEDVAKASKFAIESFAEALVPVADSLEKALQTEAATAEALREGAQLTLRQLLHADRPGGPEVRPELPPGHQHGAGAGRHRPQPRRERAAKGLEDRRPRAAAGAGDGRRALKSLQNNTH